MRIGDLFACLRQFILGIDVLKISRAAAQPRPIGDHVQRSLPVLHAVAQRSGGLGEAGLAKPAISTAAASSPTATLRQPK